MRVGLFLRRSAESVLAIPSGLVLFPFVALVHFFIKTIILGLAEAVGSAALIGRPIFDALSKKLHLPLFVAYPLTFILAIPAAAAIIFLAYPLFVLVNICKGLLSIVHAITYAFSIGFTQGFAGLIDKLDIVSDELSSWCLDFETWLDYFVPKPSVQPQPAEEEAAAPLVVEPEKDDSPVEDKAPIVKEPLCLETPFVYTTKLLDDSEVEVAEALVVYSKENADKTPSVTQKAYEQLNTKIERYKDLKKNLDQLRTALMEKVPLKDNDSIEDQLSSFDNITTPILLYKQLLTIVDGTEQWRVSPASSHITDKDRIQQWLNQGTVVLHPTTREPLQDQEGNSGTRHRWHLLTVDDCRAQELYEVAEEIRALIQLITAPAASVGNSPETLYHHKPGQAGGSEVQNSANFSQY